MLLLLSSIALCVSGSGVLIEQPPPLARDYVGLTATSPPRKVTVQARLDRSSQLTGVARTRRPNRFLEEWFLFCSRCLPTFATWWRRCRAEAAGAVLGHGDVDAAPTDPSSARDTHSGSDDDAGDVQHLVAARANQTVLVTGSETRETYTPWRARTPRCLAMSLLPWPLSNPIAVAVAEDRTTVPASLAQGVRDSQRCYAASCCHALWLDTWSLRNEFPPLIDQTVRGLAVEVFEVSVDHRDDAGDQLVRVEPHPWRRDPAVDQ